MIISFNYLIAVAAFYFAFLLNKKEADYYKNPTKLMIFLGISALLGGFDHHIELYQPAVEHFISTINPHLPHFLIPLNFNYIDDRLWFLTVLMIGFTEYFFMVSFMDPFFKGRTGVIIKNYLRFALFVYTVIVIISSQYFFVVLFHLFSHTIIILFALFKYFTTRMKAMLFLVIACVYNLSIGIMQQLMSQGVIGSGPLHYNDWYHLGVIIFVCIIYYLFTRTNLLHATANGQ